MKKPVTHLLASIFTFLIGVAAAAIGLAPPEPPTEPVRPVYTTAEVTRLVPLVPEGRPVSGGLASVKIERNDPDWEIEEVWLDAGREMSVELAPGESIENQIIVLHPFPNDRREFMIEQQFETSMAVGDEGPHADLTGWKHYTSRWKKIKRLDWNRFLTSKIAEPDRTRFPTVTRREIYNAVLKSGGRRWADLVRQCSGPDSGPCYVGVSRISFRISAKDSGEWREIHRIDVSVPLGC